MILRLCTFALLFFLISCHNNPLHINPSVYKIKTGETIEIYTTTSSCCYYCLPEDHPLQHVFFEKRSEVESAPKDCDGCSSTDAWVFRGMSAGRDTIILRNLTGGKSCNDSTAKVEQYIVIVE